MNMQSLEISAIDNDSINILSTINFEMDSLPRPPVGRIHTPP